MKLMVFVFGIMVVILMAVLVGMVIKVSKVNKKLVKVESEKSKTETELKEKSAEVSKLQKSVDELYSKIQWFSKEVESLKQTNEESYKKNCGYVKELDQKCYELQQKENELTNSNIELESKKVEVSNLNKSIEEKTASINTLEITNKDLDDKLNEAIKENKSLKSMVSEPSPIMGAQVFYESLVKRASQEEAGQLAVINDLIEEAITKQFLTSQEKESFTTKKIDIAGNIAFFPRTKEGQLTYFTLAESILEICKEKGLVICLEWSSKNQDVSMENFTLGQNDWSVPFKLYVGNESQSKYYKLYGSIIRNEVYCGFGLKNICNDFNLLENTDFEEISVYRSGPMFVEDFASVKIYLKFKNDK